MELDFNFVAPKWVSLVTSKEFFLEISKENEIIDRLPLIKNVTLFGRCDPNLVDVLCSHSSISRFHCAILFSNGLIDKRYPEGFYIQDFESTNGTFVNGKSFMSKFHFIETNSKINLGSSTRTYILRKLENSKLILYKCISLVK